MYTVEFEADASIITSMDERDRFEDVEVVLGEDGTVFIRQYEEMMDSHQLIVMSYQQLLDVVASLDSAEGMFKLELVRK